jgi:hypothetical protein
MRGAFLLPVTAVLFAACSSSSSPSADFTVRGSAGSPPALRASLMDTGDPASLRIGVYALYISPNADCSSAVLVQDYGMTPHLTDFVGNPVLFTGSPDAGAYQCVAVKMSDVITVSPDTTFGVCVAGTQYSGDIYREGETDWKDINLNPIVGTGTDSVPADDQVLIVMTRDTTAAQMRGFSTSQVLTLSSDLVVPAQSTFYWNGQGTVTDEGGQCGVNPGHPSFQ